MSVLTDDVVFFDTATLDENAIERLSVTARQLGARVTNNADDATIVLANPRSPHYDHFAGHTGYHWLAHCRYSGTRVDPGTLEPPLFVNPERARANAPLLAYVSLNIQRSAREDAPSARAAVEEQLARHGAIILTTYSAAELVIVDRKTDFFKRVEAAKQKNGRDWQRMGERFWVENCVTEREVMWATAHEVDEDEAEAERAREREREEARRRQREDSFVDDDTAQYKRGPGRPVGKPRNDYTPQEDDFLCRWLAAFRPEGGWMSRKTYDVMVSQADTFPLAARHPSQSWRERFKKNEQPFRKRVERFKRANIDDSLEDDDDRRQKAERPASTKAVVVEEERAGPSAKAKPTETVKAPAIGRSARVVAAATTTKTVVVTASTEQGQPAAASTSRAAQTAAKESSEADVGTREHSSERAVASNERTADAATTALPRAEDTGTNSDTGTDSDTPITKKDKGKGVDRSPVKPASPAKRPTAAPMERTHSDEAAAKLRAIDAELNIGRKAAPRREADAEKDRSDFLALVGDSAKKEKAATPSGAPQQSPTRKSKSATPTPPAADRTNYDETMASAILGADDDESQPADAPSPAPAPGLTQSVPSSTAAPPLSTTAPPSTEPLPPGQPRRSSPPRSSSPIDTSQEDDDSQDPMQRAIAAEYVKRKAAAAARKSLDANETKPSAEPKREYPSTPPRPRARVIEPASPERSTLSSPSIHVTVSPGRSRSGPPADATGRVRIPVTLELDIDVRTASNNTPPVSSKRLLDATSDMPPKRRRLPTESQTERVRAGHKVVTSIRDMYKEKIAQFSLQYNMAPRELYTIVNALPRKGGDRGGAVYWEDVEQGLREKFGH